MTAREQCWPLSVSERSRAGRHRFVWPLSWQIQLCHLAKWASYTEWRFSAKKGFFLVRAQKAPQNVTLKWQLTLYRKSPKCPSESSWPVLFLPSWQPQVIIWGQEGDVWLCTRQGNSVHLKKVPGRGAELLLPSCGAICLEDSNLLLSTQVWFFYQALCLWAPSLQRGCFFLILTKVPRKLQVALVLGKKETYTLKKFAFLTEIPKCAGVGGHGASPDMRLTLGQKNNRNLLKTPKVYLSKFTEHLSPVCFDFSFKYHLLKEKAKGTSKAQNRFMINTLIQYIWIYILKVFFQSWTHEVSH